MRNNQRMSILRKETKFWSNIHRGFHADPNGEQTIYVHGKHIRGWWVYGYQVKGSIIGGPSIKDIASAKLRYTVIEDTICRCTGLVVYREGTNICVPIYEYDVISVKMPFCRVKNMVVYYDGHYMRWGLMDFKKKKSGYPIWLDADKDYLIHGTYFDHIY